MKKLFLPILLLISTWVFSAPNLFVTPINPMPAQVVESTQVSNIQYQITNTNPTDTYTISFSNLAVLGKTYTTTCSSLAPTASCALTITFQVPALPSGVTSEFYPHTFFILGAPSRVPYPISTTIIQSEPSIAPTANIVWSDSNACSGTYTITLTGSDSTPHEYSNVPCGTSTLSPSLPGGVYTAHIAPAQVTEGVNIYDAPADFSYQLTKAGDTGNFTYTLNQDIAVSTNLTMPNDGGATSTIACTGPGSYTHAQGVGTTSYDAMIPGIYTCTATNYTGSDSKVYTPIISNPYTIDATHATIAITFAAQPPSTVPVSTALTMPNAPTGTLATCTITDTANTYNCSQPVGTAHCANMAPATDYTFSCGNYTVGPDVYSMPTQTNVDVTGPSTTLTGVYSKNAPPGSNYNWNVKHLDTMKSANIALISWGGGHTTGPVHTSTNPDPNPVLIANIGTYENSPTNILSTAQIQGFPGYIAMGTISEPTSSVTDQLKTQKLDFTNKYEAPFGNSPGGCYWQQQNAASVSEPNFFLKSWNWVKGLFGFKTTTVNAQDLWYNANQAAGLQPFNWKAGTNLVPAGTYVVAGDVYIAAQTGGGFIQYVGKIGAPIQVDANHVTIPETFIALPKNSSIGRPNLANNQTVTFTVTTYVSTNVTFGAQAPTSGTSLINMAENMCGSYFYTTGGYTPVVNDVAAQAATVKATTGHNMVAGIVFYTVPMSVSNDQIIDALVNDYNVQTNLYNLATEAILMQAQYTTNGVNMALLINPDTTNIFQNCAQWNCAIQWKKGLTQDTTGLLVQIPNLAADLNAVIDRLVAYSQITSSQATAIKAAITSQNILAIPSGSGLTAPGMQNFFLASNFLMKQLAPNVPFGYGFNIYDNANPLMAVGTCPTGTNNCSYETASITWVHKVNHSGYSPTTVAQAIQFEANKDATFMKDLNFADYTGNPYTALMPDFMFRDRFEQDVIYSEVGQGYLLNGVDWDTYMAFITAMNNGGIIKPIPTMLWQMPGAGLQVQGATWPSNALGDDMVDYTFGNPSLKNDFSNVAACTTITPSPATLPCNWYGTDFTGYLNTSVYFTANSNVKNTIDYLKLTSSSP